MADSSNVVTLTSPQHHQALISGLWKFYNSQHALDFHVYGAGRTIRAHQLILEIFVSPKDLGISALNDPGEHLASLVEFLYNGTVTVNEGQLDGLLELAKKLNFSLLVDTVESAMPTPRKVAPRRRKGKPIKRITQENDSDDPDYENGSPAKRTRRRDQQQPRTRGRRVSGGGNLQKRRKCSSTDRDSSGSQSINGSEGPANSDSHSSPHPPPEGEDGLAADSSKDKDRSITIRCKECNYKTHLESRFQLHMARRHDPTTTMLPCSVCSKPFRNAGLLAHHMLSHAGQPTVYRCQHCPYETEAVKNYQYHLRSSHELNARGEPAPKRFRCDLCSYACLYKSDLLLHKTAKHSTAKPFSCEQCTYTSSTKANLHRHVKVFHLNIRPHMCEVCGTRCPSNSHLEKHRRMHTGEKPYVCSTCGKAYASRDAWKSHVRRHVVPDEKPFVCHVCGYSCNRKDNLRVHLRNVHDARMFE